MIPALKTTIASICLGGLVTVLAPLVAPASAAQLQRCASENGICQLPYPAEVVYGTGGRNTSRFIDRPQVNCSNRVFGDPAPGQKKSCSFVVQDRWDRPDRPGRPDRRDRPGRYDPYDRYEDRDRDRDWSAARRKAVSVIFTGASASATALRAGSRKASSGMAFAATIAPSAIRHAARPRPATFSTKNPAMSIQKPGTNSPGFFS